MKHFRADELPGDGDGRFREMVIEAPTMRAGMLGFEAGEVVPRHAHHESEELFLFLSGRCMFEAGGERCEVGEGDIVLVAPGEGHTFTAHTPLRVLAVVSPNVDDHELVADDERR